MSPIAMLVHDICIHRNMRSKTDNPRSVLYLDIHFRFNRTSYNQTVKQGFSSSQFPISEQQNSDFATYDMFVSQLVIYISKLESVTVVEISSPENNCSHLLSREYLKPRLEASLKTLYGRHRDRSANSGCLFSFLLLDFNFG